MDRAINDWVEGIEMQPSLASPIKKYAGLLFGLAGLALMYIAKIIRIKKGMYFSDSFSNLQMSRSLFDSGRLLQENCWDIGPALHSSYICLLFAPLTSRRFGLSMGIEAFVIVQFMLTALGFFKVGSRLLLTHGRMALTWWTLLMVSPISVWLLDWPIYGWTVELLYPSLAVLLAYSLSLSGLARCLVEI